MTSLAGVALVLDCYLVLVLTVLGVLTNQDSAFLWFTLAMAAVLAVGTASFAKLLGARDAEFEEGSDEAREDVSRREFAA